MRKVSVVVLAILALAVLAACGSDDDSVVGEGTEATTAASDGAESVDSAEHNDADVKFAQSMIPHHEQAVEMAQLATTRADSAKVKDLAVRIEAAQQPEIDTMTAWLEEWNEEIGGAMDHGEMGGMMSEDDMSQLEAASGAEFDRMFLEMMKEHHQGAIDMAQTELDEGSYPPALDMAQEIIDGQTEEIEEIDELLAEM